VSERVGLKDLWSEKDLIEHLNLRLGKSGRSKTLGNWINRGLPYFKHGDRRFFLGLEVMAFIKENLAKGQRCGSV
jgi:hypothetical protein